MFGKFRARNDPRAREVRKEKKTSEKELTQTEATKVERNKERNFSVNEISVIN